MSPHFTRWRRQALTVARLEITRNVIAWRSLWLLFVGFSPVFMIAGHALFDDTGCKLEEETLVLAGIIQLFYLRCAIFFGCLGVFLRLIRGEAIEHTQHYSLLAPVRREVLLVGKFLAGAFTTVTVFGTGVLASSRSSPCIPPCSARPWGAVGCGTTTTRAPPCATRCASRGP